MYSMKKSIIETFNELIQLYPILFQLIVVSMDGGSHALPNDIIKLTSCPLLIEKWFTFDSLFQM